MSAVALFRIAERLSASTLANTHEQADLFEAIRELRTGGEAEYGAEVLRRMEAAGMLVGYLARMGELAGEDVREIAVKLLRDAAEGLPVPGGGPRTAHKGEAPAPAPSPESATELIGDMMLGQILRKKGYILDEHVHQALKMQRSTSQPLGEVLVKIGACTQAQVSEALTQQAALRRVRKNARQESVFERNEPLGTGLKIVGEVLLGELLLQRNVITRRQLERALEVQKKEGLRVGEALVKIGATTLEQIEQALKIQSRDRRFGIRGSDRPTDPSKNRRRTA
jgi:hypothetical protein